MTDSLAFRLWLFIAPLCVAVLVIVERIVP